MKPSSGTPKNLSRTKARNALLLNQLATPGLGSLLAGRWIAGTGQLLCSVAGCILLMVWFIKLMLQYYGEMSGNVTPTPVAWMGWWGGGLFIGSWLWSGYTSLSLFLQASQSQKQALERYASHLVKLDEASLGAHLTLLPAWQRQDQLIVREFRFADFSAALQFVNQVAALAEQAGHHPDIDIRWNKVKLSLTTHDAGGLTENDFALARKLDALAPAR